MNLFLITFWLMVFMWFENGTCMTYKSHHQQSTTCSIVWHSFGLYELHGRFNLFIWYPWWQTISADECVSFIENRFTPSFFSTDFQLFLFTLMITFFHCFKAENGKKTRQPPSWWWWWSSDLWSFSNQKMNALSNKIIVSMA